MSKSRLLITDIILYMTDMCLLLAVTGNQVNIDRKHLLAALIMGRRKRLNLSLRTSRTFISRGIFQHLCFQNTHSPRNPHLPFQNTHLRFKSQMCLLQKTDLDFQISQQQKKTKKNYQKSQNTNFKTQISKYQKAHFKRHICLLKGTFVFQNTNFRKTNSEKTHFKR